jgi:GDPmannose 4,6-dehydratase
MKTALITGINGMDGSHLADLLLEKGYKVFGIEKESNRTNTKHLEGKVTFLKGDLTNQNSLLECIKNSNPDEIYNLGSKSFVGDSWSAPTVMCDVTAVGVLRMLEAIREYGEPVKFFQASTCEMFGNSGQSRHLQYPLVRLAGANEETHFYPRSPYGIAKLYGHWMVRSYRETYDMFACSGILFNHESERRGIKFVTRKITDGVARIHLGLEDKITLGNLDAARDWGYAPDYCEAMWLMLQQDENDFKNKQVGDFVVSTGKTHTIREFLDLAFQEVGISNWNKYVEQDEKYMRPIEVNCVLKGDSSKAKDILGWKPKTSFEHMVSKMVKNDIKRLESK